MQSIPPLLTKGTPLSVSGNFEQIVTLAAELVREALLLL